MDQRGQDDTLGYGSTGYEYWPCHQPGRREAYGDKPKVSYSVFGVGMLNLQSGLESSSFDNSQLPVSPRTYSGSVISQGTASCHGPAGLRLQDGMHCRTQECGMWDHIPAKTETIPHPGQPHADSMSRYALNIGWEPDGPSFRHLAKSFNYSPIFPCLNCSTSGANCRTHPLTIGSPVYNIEPGDAYSDTHSRFPGSKNSFLRQLEEMVPSNRELPTQDTRPVSPPNNLSDVPYLEQTGSGSSPRRLGTGSFPNKPVTAHENDGVANNGTPKKRKRKSRTDKPRKPRTLTNEGKVHAKAVRESPGGACADCRRRKSKCTHKLPQDMPTESPNKLTPNTPWTEPPTPDNGPGNYDPVLYRSSQEDYPGY